MRSSVLYDLDALTGQARYKSPKFMSVFHWFEPQDLPRAWAWELCVALATPGFSPRHWFRLFRWTSASYAHVPRILAYFKDDETVGLAARANFAALTSRDGEDWLHAMREVNDKRWTDAPLVVNMYLREQRKLGRSAADVAAQFRVREQLVGKAMNVVGWDMLSGRDLREQKWETKYKPSEIGPRGCLL